MGLLGGDKISSTKNGKWKVKSVTVISGLPYPVRAILYNDTHQVEDMFSLDGKISADGSPNPNLDLMTYEKES